MAAEPEDATARWQRRVDRERRARLQAERIAEDSIRTAWERQREIELLSAVAISANEASGAIDVVAAGLALIAGHLGWPGAFAWLVDSSNTRLEPVAEWPASGGSPFPQTRARWADVPIRLGEGLAGRVATASESMWGEEVVAGTVGEVGQALLVPLRAGQHVVGVAGFAHRVPVTLAEGGVHLVEQACDQIGLAVDRARFIAELDQARRELDVRVVERTAEAEEARHDARAANRAKEALLVALTHEVRTPLNGVLGMLELALLEDPPPPVGDYARAAESSARTLLGLFNVLVELVEENLDPDRIEEWLRHGLQERAGPGAGEQSPP